MSFSHGAVVVLEAMCDIRFAPAKGIGISAIDA